MSAAVSFQPPTPCFVRCRVKL